jgi:hypothetical protein
MSGVLTKVGEYRARIRRVVTYCQFPFLGSPRKIGIGLREAIPEPFITLGRVNAGGKDVRMTA